MNELKFENEVQNFFNYWCIFDLHNNFSHADKNAQGMSIFFFYQYHLCLYVFARHDGKYPKNVIFCEVRIQKFGSYRIYVTVFDFFNIHIVFPVLLWKNIFFDKYKNTFSYWQISNRKILLLYNFLRENKYCFFKTKNIYIKIQ